MIELGRRTPRPETAYKLGQVLGVNPVNLYMKILEYNMESVGEEKDRGERVPADRPKHTPHRTLRVVAKENETPKEMLARLLHRQLHPFHVYLRKINMGQAEFLKKIDVSRGTIINWLDRNNTPNISTLKKISAGLSVPIETLLEEDNTWEKEDLSDPVHWIEENVERLGR